MVVALEHLGFDVVSGTGATIEDVVPDTPADGVIEPGDTVVRAGGQPVERVEDFVAEIDARDPGDELTLVLEPGDDGAPRRRTMAGAARQAGHGPCASRMGNPQQPRLASP